MTAIIDQPQARTPKRTPLGEELPIFCERCGYSLFGLPQNRCENCTILQFHCPECGHHQPINTLRPAAQTILGRVRGVWLVWVIVFKLAFFVLTLIAWAGMGNNWSYDYDWEAYRLQQAQLQAQLKANPNSVQGGWAAPPVLLAQISWEAAFAFSIFGIAWGGVARMMLLRWRHGWMVGVVLASLALVAMWVGVAIRRVEMADRQQWDQPWPFHLAFVEMNLVGIVFIVLGATIAWGAWTLLVKAFLPKRTSESLLEWQRSLSISVASLTRDRHNLIQSSASPTVVPAES